MGKNKFKHNLLIVLTSTIIGAATGSAIGNFAFEPVYTTTSRYYIKNESTDYNEKENAKDYICFFSSDELFGKIALNSGLTYTSKEVEKMIDIDSVKKTYFFDISVTCKSASDAYQLQQAVFKSQKEYIKENVSKITNADFSIDLVDEADFPENPSSKNVIKITLLCAVLGLIFGTAIFISRLKDCLFETEYPINDEDEKELSGHNILAKIPQCNQIQKNETVIVNTGDNNFDTIFLQLYGEVKYESDNPCNVIIVCSPEKNEGTTTTAVNLAISAAADSMRVLLLDCNFRNSDIKKYFLTQQNQSGFSDIIKKEIIPENAIITTPYDSLFLLTTGAIPENPLTILTSPQMPDTMQKLRSMFDYIIIDTPAINDFSDVLTMSEFADTLLLVTSTTNTDSSAFEKAIKSFELSSKKSITGIVYNHGSENDFSQKKNKKNRFINYKI